MDPIEVREERVATSSRAAPVVPAERGFPVHGTETSAPVTEGPVATAPVAAAPVAAAPVAAAPLVPGSGTTVYSSRVTASPVGYRSIQLIWLIAGVVDIILALDFIFRAASAHNTGFAHYIYRLAGWLAAPFNGIFNATTAANGSVIRWSDVLAVVIYTVAAWIVTRLVRISATPRTGVGSL